MPQHIPVSVAMFKFFRPAFSSAVGGRSSMTTPTRLARNFTDSGKVRPSIRMMKPKTSPPAPQPKQWNISFAGFTLNEGVFSP
jgi:hypothetical protein